MKHRKIITDNKGLTLIELIVCILMLSLISGMVAMFVMTSTNSYNIIHNEVQMQTEADVALTFINELAVEARDYGYVGNFTHATAGECSAMCIYAPDSLAKSVTETSVENCYYFIWHQNNDNKLRFCKFSIGDAGIVKLEGHSELNSIADIDIVQTVSSLIDANDARFYLAQYVTGFSAELPDDSTTYPVLRLNIELEYAGSHFSAKKTIASRNLMAGKNVI
jgi:prepilin-type N-terminal cleavage/methylation domain-containing protein